jgi:uncharacterized membrane protein YgdD (TMEM256/DUF423 family)
VSRFFLTAAGILGALGVGLGAFGAHGLKGWLKTLDDGADRLAWWHTGVQYHVWHALLLAAVGLVLAHTDSTPARVAGVACLVGIALFSGSLYAMTFTGIRVLGAVTPLGGVAFLVAWIALAVAARKL